MSEVGLILVLALVGIVAAGAVIFAIIAVVLWGQEEGEDAD